jgi:L-rhamnose mutarotase
MQTRRLCLALDLKDDPELIARYRDWHAPGRVPSAIIASIREAGIEEMELYLTGNRLIMILAVNEHFSFAAKAAADAANPDVQAWEKLMWEFQQALPWARAGEKWLTAERIFALSEQP